MKHTAYRADIDGLRAIAVLSVVLFHLKVSGFAGGFVGVDIFFVISGYLITRNILADGLAFSFSDFYTRRARRIFPALIATVLGTYVLGFMWLSPEFFRQLAKESTHALLSISNIQYWRESSDYFAPTADQLALLHCWSLSLEEQFYLVWPILIILASRTSRIFSIILVAGAVSFLGAVLFIKNEAQAVFFLMPFRVCEFAVGAFVIACEHEFPALGNSKKLTLFWFGLGTIAASVVFFGSLQAYAGIGALVPCIGAAAIILANFRARVLANKPMLAVGVISYSLYLCHWPLIFFGHVVFGEAAASWLGTLLLGVLMLAVASVMYRFIEQPFRRTSSSRRLSAVKYLTLVLCAVALTHATFLSGGFSWRLNDEALARTRLLSFGMQPCMNLPERHCAFGDLDAPIGLELLGDSYIQQYVGAIHPLLQNTHLRGETSTEGGCLMLLGLPESSATTKRCQAARDRELAKSIQSSSSLVVIGQNWTGYGVDTEVLRTALVRTIEGLSKPARRFLIVGAQVKFSQCAFDRIRMLPGPLSRFAPYECAPVRAEQARMEGDSINRMVASVRQQFPDKVRVLIPVEAFCDDVCPVVAGGLWLYQDEGHFTLAGSRYMGVRANDLLLSFLSPER